LQHNFRVFVLELPLKNAAEGHQAIDERRSHQGLAARLSSTI
jgi:hypothetical protein